MTAVVRVGTRRSPLARAQTDEVLRLLRRAVPSRRFLPRPLDTSGDAGSASAGSTDFTDAIDRALAAGELDLAVHSAKDLPATLDPRFVLAACPPREDPRDCLVVRPTLPSARLPSRARVGSSSLRRRAQLLRWRPDLSVVAIRGNVDTRLSLVHAGAVDAAILAVAGLSRLERRAEVRRLLSYRDFLPAPAQGAIAVIARGEDSALVEAVGRIDHIPTHRCVEAERAFSAALGGDCDMPLGALATGGRRSLSITGEVLSADGTRRIRGRRSGPPTRPTELGRDLGRALRRRGALALVATSRT